MILASSGTFDVALLDVNLDGKMSWNVASVLRARGIPFVFGKGYDAANILPEFLAGSMVVAKPYEERDLGRLLRQAIAERAEGVSS